MADRHPRLRLPRLALGVGGRSGPRAVPSTLRPTGDAHRRSRWKVGWMERRCRLKPSIFVEPLAGLAPQPASPHQPPQHQRRRKPVVVGFREQVVHDVQVHIQPG